MLMDNPLGGGGSPYTHILPTAAFNTIAIQIATEKKEAEKGGHAMLET